MNDQYQHEHVTRLENDHFYEDTIETPPVTAEPVQDAGNPVEKTEPWKPSAPAPAAQMDGNAGYPEMLLSSEETQHFRARWNEVQARFVDEPRSSVQEADALVNELMTQISQIITNEHRTLEGQWNQGGDISTENLRQILQRYRSFFNRLLI
jgi:hypothetical protein